MRKIFTTGIVLVFVVASSIFAQDNKKSDEIKKLESQQQALVQQRAQYISATQKIEIEILKVQAVIDYLKKQEKEDKKK